MVLAVQKQCSTGALQRTAGAVTESFAVHIRLFSFPVSSEGTEQIQGRAYRPTAFSVLTLY